MPTRVLVGKQRTALRNCVYKSIFPSSVVASYGNGVAFTALERNNKAGYPAIVAFCIALSWALVGGGPYEVRALMVIGLNLYNYEAAGIGGVLRYQGIEMNWLMIRMYAER